MAKNTGGYQNSAEGKRNHRIVCGDLELIYDTNVEEAQNQAKAGDQKGARASAEAAAECHSDAKKLGCSWV
jgi:hypothetical protein